MNISEELYILYRRGKAVASWLVYLGCSIFPIKQHKIVFSAFEGGGYGCNPKYIAEELIRRMRETGESYELVWLVNDLTKTFPSEIQAVKNDLWHRAYHLSTAKVWVDNARKNYGTRKRKGQLYVQTWHGQIGVKPVGRLRGKSFSRIAELVTKADAALIDEFLIDSEWARDIFGRAFYQEPLLLSGSPRCDILLNERAIQHEKVRREYSLPTDSKILIYAPTFRGGSQSKHRDVFESEISLDFDRLVQSLERRFGGEWYIFLRLHPQLAAKMDTMLSRTGNQRLIDISQKDDLYEYLAGTDAFITDYSSAGPDAAMMDIPVFVYADDLDKYMADRGSLLRDLREFPFSVARTNDELEKNILDFAEGRYLDRLHTFFRSPDIQMFEDGKASHRIADFIENYIEKGGIS